MAVVVVVLVYNIVEKMDILGLPQQQRESGGERGMFQISVCVCVCVCVRERERERSDLCVCVP